MSEDIVDLRKGDRFVVADPISATFNGGDAWVMNLGVAGVQIRHPHTLRIGTKGTLALRIGPDDVAVPAHVVWSHLSQTAEGGLLYQSGLRFVELDAHFAAGLNALIRNGRAVRDDDSLDRKRQRELEREQRRQTPPKLGFLPPQGS